MDAYLAARRRCVANVALLWSQNEVPGHTSERELVPSNSSRKIPIHREKQLADDFAFICGIDDDPEHIKAVCIEEDLDGNGMTIRTAMNKGDLSSTVDGLVSIAKVMMRATSRNVPKHEVYDEILKQIVQLCQKRILSRIRSKHASRTQKTKGKPALARLLVDAVRQSSGHRESPMLAELETQCENFKNCFNEVELCENRGDRSTCLCHLLLSADGIKTTLLRTMLSSHATIDPSLKIYLPQAVEKLSRYVRVAKDFANAARANDCGLYDRITITWARVNAVGAEDLARRIEDYDVVCARVFGDSGTKHSFHTPRSFRQRYEKRLLTVGTEWKVHAEIQLVMFYEMHPDIPRPRIISSSKSACYLCDLFIQTHGQYSVPRTHGRLYDKWTLPEGFSNDLETIGTILPIVQLFNENIEQHIRTMFAKGRQSWTHPNESVAAIYSPWPSVSTITQEESGDSAGRAGNSIATATGGKEEASIITLSSATTATPRLKSLRASLSTESDTDAVIAPGLSVCKDIKADQDVFFQTDLLHLYVSMCDGKEADNKSGSEKFTKRVTVKNHGHVSHISDRMPLTRMVDVGKLQCGQDVTIALENDPATIMCVSKDVMVGLTIDSGQVNEIDPGL